jgi:hypothetical protein
MYETNEGLEPLVMDTLLDRQRIYIWVKEGQCCARAPSPLDELPRYPTGNDISN